MHIVNRRVQTLYQSNRSMYLCSEFYENVNFCIYLIYLFIIRSTIVSHDEYTIK